ncbi:MAG: hypothetical protein ABFD50_02590 [Smithella sp.]
MVIEHGFIIEEESASSGSGRNNGVTGAKRTPISIQRDAYFCIEFADWQTTAPVITLLVPGSFPRNPRWQD